jgi:hypothetical protein
MAQVKEKFGRSSKTLHVRHVDFLKCYETEVFFVDEMWTKNNLAFSKCWQIPLFNGVMDIITGNIRLTAGHMETIIGILLDAQLIYKPGS